MLIVGSLWFVWLIVFCVSLSLALRIQYLRTKAISRNVGHTVTSVLSGDPEMIGESAQRITNDLTDGIFGGLWKFFVWAAVAVISGLLFIVSVFINSGSYLYSLFS